MRKHYTTDSPKTSDTRDINHNESKPPFRYELHRIQMRQFLNPGGIIPSPLLENDFSATSNFRTLVQFTSSRLPSEGQGSMNDDVYRWDLRNMYAAKGTVSGFVTANVVLSGLNHVENRLMAPKKWVPYDFKTLLSYLAHERTVETQTFGNPENMASWGLARSERRPLVYLRQRYTYALGRSKRNSHSFQFSIALKTRSIGGLDDVYAKHGTLCDEKLYAIQAAGELSVLEEKSQDGFTSSFVMCLDNDSGTFRPSSAHIRRAEILLSSIFEQDTSLKSHKWKIVVASRPKCLPKDAVNDATRKKLYRNYHHYMSKVYPQALEQREDILQIASM